MSLSRFKFVSKYFSFLFIAFLFFGCGLTTNDIKEIIRDYESKNLVYKKNPFTFEMYKLYYDINQLIIRDIGWGLDENEEFVLTQKVEHLFTEWLFEKKYITSKDSLKSVLPKGRCTFVGDFTQDGIRFFASDSNIIDFSKKSGLPRCFNIRMLIVSDYVINYFKESDGNIFIVYSYKYDWIDSEYTRYIKDKLKNKISLPSIKIKVIAKKSENGFWKFQKDSVMYKIIYFDG